MLRNYLVSALRNLVRFKMYTFISLFGLSIGISGCIVFLSVVADQASFDRFHEDINRIYKLVRRDQDPNTGADHSYRTFGPLAPSLMDAFPEIEVATRLMTRGVFVKGDGEVIRMTVGLTDANFLELFSVAFLKGDRSNVFQKPNVVVITESAARKIFVDDDPLGKTLTGYERYLGDTYIVGGVVADFPKNSHLKFDILTATPAKNRFIDGLKAKH